ncbi:MAG: hypothetical protein IIC01_02410, partial [Planctomycetes bacterium]|nr:hypothetical protein [Planctomycetota bacterium]
VYHELAEYKVDIDPRAFDVDEQALVSGAAGIDKIFENSQKYLDWLLLPFKTVETANRGIAFYAAKHSGAKAMRINPHLIPTMDDGTKMAGDALNEYLNLHSARTVNVTQFNPGGGSRTIAQDAVAPWLRTFTSFPVRLLSWMGESTVRGAATEAEMQTAGMLSKMTGGRNFGTLARLYVSGRVLQTGFRDAMGLDVNRWVGFGPADAGQDLVIFPVPPIAGAAVATMKYLSSGDIDDLQPVNIPGVGKIPLPRTLVPGGVALNRLGRAIEQWDSDAGGMVDEDQRPEDILTAIVDHAALVRAPVAVAVVAR